MGLENEIVKNWGMGIGKVNKSYYQNWIKVIKKTFEGCMF